jgi:hypothetical protein
MRARNIKPGFWENEKIGQLTHTQRLLFIGLWCLADREGKLEDRPDRIQHLLFGYDNKKFDIHRELTVIERLGFTYHYKVKDTPLIMVLGFKKHQSPHHTERKSNLPDPESFSLINGELTVSHGEYPPDSPNHESRIMNHESCQEVPFTDFYSLYPKKVNKEEAKNKWLKLKPTRQFWEETIKPGLLMHINSDQWKQENGKFIPNPAKWLLRKRWEDEIKENIDWQNRPPQRHQIPSPESKEINES